MDPVSPFARYQARRLNQIRSLGEITDESLASYLREAGESCDRSTLTKYRAGTRTAPFGIIDLILNHSSEPAAILNIWAHEHGLKVVRDEDLDTEDMDLADRAMDVAAQSGRVVEAVRNALTGGRVTEDERETVRAAASELRKMAEELESWGRRGAA